MTPQLDAIGISILALFVSVLSLAWNMVQFAHSGPRVDVRMRNDGYFGTDVATIIVKVRNGGRYRTVVDRIEVFGAEWHSSAVFEVDRSRSALSPYLGSNLPREIEGKSSAMWIVPPIPKEDGSYRRMIGPQQYYFCRVYLQSQQKPYIARWKSTQFGSWGRKGRPREGILTSIALLRKPPS